VPEKKKHNITKSDKSAIFHLYGEAPAVRIEMKMCSGVDRGNVSTSISNVKNFRDFDVNVGTQASYSYLLIFC